MSAFFTTEISSPQFESGGLRCITVKSKALNRRADITVYLPQDAAPRAVVMLLHGVYGSHWAWAFNGGVHITAARLIAEHKIKPVVLVMPSDGLFGDGSGYLPHHTADYERWIAEEVMLAVREKIEVVTDRLPVFITGLSMGGYGAMRIGAKYPETFTSFSGLSAITAFDQMQLFLENHDDHDLKQNVLKQESVLEIIRANQQRLPFFRFDCGTDDLLIRYNRALHDTLHQLNIAHEYKEYPGGHNWTYWQEHIADTLRFFNDVLNRNYP